MTPYARIQERLKELGIEPKRSLGQNFLISEHVIQKIIRETRALKPSAIIEIGPGLGSLTDELRNLGVPLTLIEFDRKLAEYWGHQGIDGVTLVEQDAMKINWNKFPAAEGSVLVSNLPFQIASRLLIELSMAPDSIKKMVLMFQKEVARKILAKQKTEDYGLLTVLAQTFWKTDFLLEAGPGDFFPKPRIASQVVVFSRKPSSLNEPERFLGFVKLAFAQRRKLVIKNLSSYPAIPRVFEEFGIHRQARAEEISPMQYLEIFAKIVPSGN